LLVRVAETRGRRPAVALTVWATACYGLLWVGTGQALADLPAFWRTSLEIANSYGEGMGKFGPREEVAVGVAAAGLLVVAAGLRASFPPSPPRGEGRKTATNNDRTRAARLVLARPPGPRRGRGVGPVRRVQNVLRAPR